MQVPSFMPQIWRPRSQP